MGAGINSTAKHTCSDCAFWDMWYNICMHPDRIDVYMSHRHQACDDLELPFEEPETSGGDTLS